jgi:peptide/nickel transport system permease protein
VQFPSFFKHPLVRFLVKRFIQSGILILALSCLLFFLVRITPGDPLVILYGLVPEARIPPEEIAAYRHRLGLDQPIPVQYLNWLWNALHGDLGYSLIMFRPVSALLIEKAVNTLELVVVSYFFSILIGLLVGAISAAKQYSISDYICSSIVLFLYSMPGFWLALILISVFSTTLRWLPTSGMYSLVPIDPPIIDHIKHMILPVIVLSTTGLAYIARLMRSSMLEVLNEDYILLARSKGLSERKVLFKHAFRNALLPTVSMMGIYMSLLISYSAIVEAVFAWPGLGFLIVSACTQRDYPVILGATLFISLIVVAGVLLSDIIIAFLDPRIRRMT